MAVSKTDDELIVPEFILDAQRAEVRPGDRIAYAAQDGDRSVLRFAEVLNFQYARESWGNSPRPLKVKVRGEHGRYYRDAPLVAVLSDFAKIVKIAPREEVTPSPTAQ